MVKESSFDSFEDIKEELRELYVKEATEKAFDTYAKELFDQNSVLNAYVFVSAE